MVHPSELPSKYERQKELAQERQRQERRAKLTENDKHCREKP